MKSGRQRRAEIKLRRQEKRLANSAKNKYLKGVSAVNQYDWPLGCVPVNPANLSPNNSYGIPEFIKRGIYVDMSFTCKHCVTPQIWTAQQQHWWYELAKGDVWTIAVLCRPCRIKERERKALARKIHLEGLLRITAT
jgi:Probable zinc-ribbon domain